VQGSSSVNPEQIDSYELGYQGWFFKHRLRARADLFFNHITDLISFQSQGAVTVAANNGGVADIYGGEAGIEYLATSWLTGFANYSYQEIGQSFTGPVQRGAPKYKFNVGLRAEGKDRGWSEGLSAEAVFHYYGAATYPSGNAFVSFSSPPLSAIPAPNTQAGSYNLLNLRGAYQFWKVEGQKRAEFAVTAFNALNDKHKEHPLGDTIGSRVMGWLTLKF
jgi:iron complex outermembrane receptor protein